jgi:hypothetical protein
MGKTIMVIPDTQVAPGRTIEHLKWAGEYAAAKKPDRIIHLGDHWDMPSLSLYDVGKKSFEGRSYRADIDAGKRGLEAFDAPIKREMRRSNWNPDKRYLDGNHDYRIIKTINADRKLEGLIGLEDRGLEESKWKVHPFLEVVRLDGIAYSHYFTSGVMGRPISSARMLVTKKHMSCIMGHVQKAEIDFQYNAEGKRLTGIFAGCFYQHDEDYLDPQSNRSTWRGIWMLYNVVDGEFTLNNVPLNFLRNKYGKAKKAK